MTLSKKRAIHEVCYRSAKFDRNAKKAERKRRTSPCFEWKLFYAISIGFTRKEKVCYFAFVLWLTSQSFWQHFSMRQNFEELFENQMEN